MTSPTQVWNKPTVTPHKLTCPECGTQHTHYLTTEEKHQKAEIKQWCQKCKKTQKLKH